jgi:hypothetical protein
MCESVCTQDAITTAYAGTGDYMSHQGITVDFDICNCCGDCGDTCPVGLSFNNFINGSLKCSSLGGGGSTGGDEGGNTGGGNWGGGSNNSSPNINKIRKKNILTPNDSFLLNQTLTDMLEQCGYASMYNYLVDNGAKLNDININSNIEGLAHYDPWTNTLSFKDGTVISFSLPEEFIHFFQQNYYPEGIKQYNPEGRSNIEFEAKLIQDIICTIGGSGCGYYGRGKEYEAIYDDWLLGITKNGTHFPSYNEMLERNPAWNNLNYVDFMTDFATSSAFYNYPIINDMPPSAIDYISASGCD